MLRALNLLQASWHPLQTNVRRYAYPTKFYTMLKNMPDPCITQLSNGLRVVTEECDGAEHACVGLFIDGGSRYESQFENGIAHFFEHIAFKSTCCRPPEVITKQMACTGARFKCFTTRELVAYYAECYYEDIPLVTDILSDCVFNNDLNSKEIEKQKEIVYKEMKEIDNDHNSTLFDYLHGAAFHGTPLSQSVMGPSSNLYNFCDMTIGRYLNKMFDPTRTVLAAVGGVSHDMMLQLADIYLSKLEPTKCVDDVYRFSAGDFRFRHDGLPLCNIAIAFEGPSLCDADGYIMDVAGMYLGGWDRSQVGHRDNAYHLAHAGHYANLCSAYQYFNIQYKDSGLWGVQFLAIRDEIDEYMFNLQGRFMTLCTAVTENEIERAKNELKTRLLTRTQGVTGTCLDLGKYTLYNMRRPALHERLCEIDSISAEDVKIACMHYIYDKCPAIAAVGPCESLPDTSRLRAGQYWLRT